MRVYRNGTQRKRTEEKNPLNEDSDPSKNTQKKKIEHVRFHWLHDAHREKNTTTTKPFFFRNHRLYVRMQFFDSLRPSVLLSTYVCVHLLITNAYQRREFNCIYVRNVSAKMYHDPLNTQIMIAFERFHLFSFAFLLVGLLFLHSVPIDAL